RHRASPEAQEHLIEVLSGGRSQIVADGRGIAEGSHTTRDLAIEDAKWVRRHAPSAVLTKTICVQLEIVGQHCAISCPVGCIAEAIDLQCKPGKLQASQEMPQEINDLDVGLGARRSERLDTELVELAKPPRLRTLMAKHGAKIEIL